VATETVLRLAEVSMTETRIPDVGVLDKTGMVASVIELLSDVVVLRGVTDDGGDCIIVTTPLSAGVTGRVAVAVHPLVHTTEQHI